jgi:virulence factor Mce-like protein
MSDSAARDRLKLELKRASGPFVLYVLLVIGGLLVAADIIKNLAGDKPWISYSTYKAAFSDVKNVVPGEVELRVAGVKVGSIAASQLVDGHPVLTMHLESKYAPLYRDAQIRIRPVTPLEDMYVDIVSRGHKSAGQLGNATLPESQTQSPVEISSVLDVLDADTRGEFATMLDELGRGLKDRGAKLRAGFEQVAPFLVVAKQMSAALAQRRTQLARLIHNFGGIAQALAVRDNQLKGFVENADTTLAALARSRGPLDATIAQLPPTLSGMSTAFSNLRTAEASLDPALRSLGPVASALPTGLDALSRFSLGAAPALDALRPAIHDLRPLALSLQGTSSRLQGAFTQLRPQAPQLDRVTQRAAVPSCLTYLGQFLNRAISMTKFGFGQHNTAEARTHIQVDFHTIGGLTRDPSWTISPICYRQTGASGQ